MEPTEDDATWHDYYPPAVDEYGAFALGTTPQAPQDGDWVATGHSSGTGYDATCNGWRSTHGDTLGAGISSAGRAYWTYATVRHCATPARFYCAEVGKNRPIEFEYPPSRVAFATGEDLFLPPSNMPFDFVAYADFLCQQHAQQAALVGSFKTFVALVGQSATGRLPDGLPWARPDGVLVASYSQLAAGMPLTAPLTLKANGGAATMHVPWMITGAPDSRTPGTLESTCNGWTPPYDSLMVTIGQPMESGRSYFNKLSVACDGPFEVYCFQE